MIRILAILLLSCNFAVAQITQQTITDDITNNLPTNNRNQISAELLRNTLTAMTSAIFQSQGLSGLTITGTPTVGQVPVATSSTTASWQTLGGTVTSVSNSDGSLTVSPTSGTVIASLNAAHSNTWTAMQAFSAGATVPTLTFGDNTINAASTAFVQSATGASVNVLYAQNFSGADLGAQISACIVALPVFGGVCDARGLPLTGTINTFTISRSGFTLYLPCGFHLVNGSIILQGATGVSGVVIQGCGAGQGAVGGTTLFWQGNATDPLLDLRGVRDSTFSDFTVSADSSHPLAEGIRLETWPSAVSTRRIFSNIFVNGNIANSLFKGFRWCTGSDCSSGSVIGNNDLDTLYNVSVGNYTNCAYSIEGTQSKTHTFFNSQFSGQSFSMRGVCTTQGKGTGLGGTVTFLTNGTSGCSSGTYTVDGGTGTAATLTGTAAAGVITVLSVATAGSYSVMPPVTTTLSGTGCSVAPTIAYSTNAATNAGSFRWYGGAGGSNQVADFDLGAVTDYLLINGCNFESSKRLLQTGGASSAAWTILIEGCRWTSNAINPDGKAIIYQDRGALNVTGLETETGGSTVPVILSIESSGTPEVGNAIGNNIHTASAAAGYTPFVCGTSTSVSCWSAIGNIVTDNSNNRFQVPNVLQANPLTVAQLPACTAQRKGDRQFVSDQNTAIAYHGAVTGGGTTLQGVTCDGTNWYQD